MQVEVVRGSLQGVHEKEKRHRLLLGVRVIQQAVAVEIDVCDVRLA
jgi:transcriptional antiterminator NusG